MTKNETQKRTLLATMTNEPFQPVRIYYTVPEREFVVRKFKKLECILEAPEEQCWQWLFDGESASLRFGDRGYDDIPLDRRPIILGRVRFPNGNRMTLETNSILRAIAGARFFGPRLGSDVVAMRCRVVNRLFDAGEGPMNKLMESLDQDATVIDPREAEIAIRREFKGARPGQDAKSAIAEFVDRIVKSGEDVPTVEDFPLHHEEETSDFLNLANTLQLRFVRAFEHWRGNTHLTMASIIVNTVKEGMQRVNEREGLPRGKNDPQRENKELPGLLAKAPTPGQRQMTKIGRNDPCPCGSGRKFKKCCLYGSDVV
ncbi:MAG: SEC-C domain-containing protein [Myxococcota bacterium]|nr:SEC-C domain-containing protein [Myxococcota bacterium]